MIPGGEQPEMTKVPVLVEKDVVVAVAVDVIVVVVVGATPRI